MTLRDLFTDQSLWDKTGDMDVINDCIDDMAAAWCGTLMTKAGLEHYGEDLLSTEIEIVEGDYCKLIECKIDDCPDYSKRWRKICALFDEAAGYLGCEEYDAWFLDDYELGEPDPDPYRLVINHMIDHTSLDRLKEMADEPEGDKFLKALEQIGFNVKLIKEAK